MWTPALPKLQYLLLNATDELQRETRSMRWHHVQQYATIKKVLNVHQRILLEILSSWEKQLWGEGHCNVNERMEN